MGALLDNLAVVGDQDLVAVFAAGQAMENEDRSFFAHEKTSVRNCETEKQMCQAKATMHGGLIFLGNKVESPKTKIVLRNRVRFFAFRSHICEPGKEVRR